MPINPIRCDHDNGKEQSPFLLTPKPLRAGDNYEQDEVLPKKCGDHEYYFCKNCGKIHSKLRTCNERYARCCFDYRKRRTYARLMGTKIKSKRIIHITIGFKKKPKNVPNREGKRIMERDLVKLHRNIRKKLNLSWDGLRIFDLEDDGEYEHFHYGMNPEKGMMNGRTLAIDVQYIRKQLKKATKGRSEVIKVIGYRSKKNLFYYFAKRVAGQYGHGKGTFFLEDIMTYEEYREQFFNVRSIVKIGFPEGLSCINAQSPHVCPYCNSPDIGLVAILPKEIKYKPPDWLLDYQESIQSDKLSRFW